MARITHLCLSRKENESFTVHGPAQIVIDRIDREVVRLSVVAPETTRILRDELPPKPEEVVAHGQ